jgi:hypothetical protein
MDTVGASSCAVLEESAMRQTSPTFATLVGVLPTTWFSNGALSQRTVASYRDTFVLPRYRAAKAAPSSM